MKKIFMLTCILGLAACTSTFDKENAKFHDAFVAGAAETATPSLAKVALAEDSDHFYLGGLQCGTGFLWTNETNGARQCFAAADIVFKGEVPEQSGYKVKDYEAIMGKTYEAINEVAAGDEYATQLFNQVYNLQKENVSKNEKAISDSQNDIAEEQEQWAKDMETAQSIGLDIPDFDSIVAQARQELERDQMSVMADYVNPYSTYLVALYDATANKDLSNAANYMDRVAKFAPKNTFVKDDVAAVKSGKKHIWVIFENGMLGEMVEKKLSPEILQALNINLSIPVFADGYNALPNLTILSDAKQTQTQYLANMTSVVRTDYDKYTTGNIIKSVTFEVGKVVAATAATIATKKAMGDSPFADLAAASAALAVMSVEKPWDLRYWDTLPNEVQIARIEMPASRTIDIINVGEITIPEDINNAIVFVRIPDMNAIPYVLVGKLN